MIQKIPKIAFFQKKMHTFLLSTSRSCAVPITRVFAPFYKVLHEPLVSIRNSMDNFSPDKIEFRADSFSSLDQLQAVLDLNEKETIWIKDMSFAVNGPITDFLRCQKRARFVLSCNHPRDVIVSIYHKYRELGLPVHSFWLAQLSGFQQLCSLQQVLLQSGLNTFSTCLPRTHLHQKTLEIAKFLGHSLTAQHFCWDKMENLTEWQDGKVEHVSVWHREALDSCFLFDREEHSKLEVPDKDKEEVQEAIQLVMPFFNRFKKFTFPL